jgi:hypothetical protein
MKNFTDKDIVNGNIFCDKSELIDCPLEWQKRGLTQTATGYGRKLTTSYKILFNDRKYRIYATCYGNAASTYILTKKYGKVFVG